MLVSVVLILREADCKNKGDDAEVDYDNIQCFNNPEKIFGNKSQNEHNKNLANCCKGNDEANILLRITTAGTYREKPLAEIKRGKLSKLKRL